jgi:hypothetical protein
MIRVRLAEGAGVFAFELRQSLINALAALHISVIVVRREAADAKVEEGVPIGINEPRFAALLLHMEEPRLLQPKRLTTSRKAAKLIELRRLDAASALLRLLSEFFGPFENLTAFEKHPGSVKIERATSWPKPLSSFQ